jgi:hypothetical protein
MKNIALRISLFTGMAVCALGIGLGTASGQGTAFTYQGYLNNNGAPANGLYDLSFLLFTTNSGGGFVAGPLTNIATGVTNGLFTVSLDFGSGPFGGGPLWLELAVRTNGGNAFTTLDPRQPVTPVPYAITAGNLNCPLPSGLLGGAYGNAVTLNNPANNFIGNGTGLTNVNATSLDGLGAGSFWNVSGNAGTSPGLNFLGTVDNEALELHVNGQRALRLEPDTNGAPNFIGGATANFVNSGNVGAVIGGGGAMNYRGSAYTNEVASDFGTIGGGAANAVWPHSPWGTIGGGCSNAVGGTNSTVAGGIFNFVDGTGAFIGGGLSNRIDLDYFLGQWQGAPDGSGSTIAGGLANFIWDGDSYGMNTVGGGGSNSIDESESVSGFGNTIAGGVYNLIRGTAFGHTIGGGNENSMGEPNSDSGYCVIAGGFQNAMSGGESYGGCTISGGADNLIGSFYSSFYDCTIAGGAGNFVDGYDQTIAGGAANTIESFPFYESHGSAIGGGESNLITEIVYGTISGGLSNVVNGNYAAIPGGFMNVASGAYSLAAGNMACATNQGAFVWADSTGTPVSSTTSNQFTVRASGGVLFYSNPGATAGVSLASGSGSWTTLSDRNSKENLQPVDAQTVLEKVAALPMNTWNYKTQAAAIRHIGPMAQDFKAAFGVGETETGIATVDEDGVALAAIQGLNQKLNEKDAEIQDLKQSVAELKKMVQSMGEKQSDGQ